LFQRGDIARDWPGVIWPIALACAQMLGFRVGGSWSRYQKVTLDCGE
jgi:hypothetical protein